jgi:hypothetical protein
MGITRFHPPRKQRGITTMSSLPADDESGFETSLPNLTEVPLKELRHLTSSSISSALLRVVQQTERPSKTKTQCSSAAPID